MIAFNRTHAYITPQTNNHWIFFFNLDEIFYSTLSSMRKKMVFDIIDAITFNRFCTKKLTWHVFLIYWLLSLNPTTQLAWKKSRTLCTVFNVSESVAREMSGIKRAPCVTDYAGGWHWCGPVIHVIMCNNIPKHLQIHTHDTNKIYNTYRQQILFEIYDNRRNIITHNLEVIKNCLLLHRRGVYYL